MMNSTLASVFLLVQIMYLPAAMSPFVLREGPRAYCYNASDRDDPFRSGHHAYDYRADDQYDRLRSGYEAHDYRGGEQDALRNGHRADDYRARSNDEGRRDGMRYASRNEPGGNYRCSEARPFNGRNDDRRQQPSRQPAKSHHDPTKINRYVPERPDQGHKAVPGPVNVQAASDQRQDPSHRSERKSGNVQRREEAIMRDMFRAWFTKPATRYYACKGRVNATNVSKWSIPLDVIKTYLHDGSTGGKHIPDVFKARGNDADYVRSLFKWRIPIEKLDAYWDVNGVKHPDWSSFDANIDKELVILEAPTQVLRDRTVNAPVVVDVDAVNTTTNHTTPSQTTPVKQEPQPQSAEQAFFDPTNADVLSDLELFDSETFFMSRRRP